MFEWALQLNDRELQDPFPIRELDVELELTTVSAVLIESCALLEDSGIATFTLRCGGTEPWPVNILGELSMLLEGLVPALRGLREPEGQARIELVEQGVENALSLRRQGDSLQVVATDLWDGRPSRFGSATEEVPVEEFVAQTERLVSAFGEAIRRACPAIIDEALFGAWLRDVHRELVDLRRSRGMSAAAGR